MLKILITFCIYLVSLNLYASKLTSVLKCLVNEETKIHISAMKGPIHKLNQKMISILIEQSTVEFKPLVTKNVCNHPKFTPSVALLEQILIYGNKAFIVEGSYDETNQDHVMKAKAKENLIQQSPTLLFGFLSSLQAIATKPSCMENHLRNLSQFYEKFKYLQAEQQVDQLFSDKRKLKSLFNDLRNIDRVLKLCKKGKS